MKKFLFWIIILVAITALIILILFLKNRTGKFPKTKPAKISSAAISYPALSGDAVYYLDKDKLAINKLDLKSGKSSEANNLSVVKSETGQISDLQIIWNQNSKEQYLIYREDEDSLKIKWYWGNLKSGQIKKVPLESTNSSRWKDGANIVYIDYDNNLKIFNLDSFKETFKKRVDSPNVLEIFPSPDGEKVIITETLEGEATSSPVWIYYFKTSEIKNLGKVFIRTPLWSPNSKGVLFDKYIPGGQGKMEGIFIWSEKEQKQLNFGSALKSAWIDEDFVLLALPQEQTTGFDNLYKIDLKSDNKTLIFESLKKERFDFENLMPTKDGKTLYFTSDDYLYKLQLSK